MSRNSTMKVINAASIRAFRVKPTHEVITDKGKVLCASLADALGKMDIYRKLKIAAVMRKLGD